MIAACVIYVAVAIAGLVFWPGAVADTRAGAVWFWATWFMTPLFFVWRVGFEWAEDEGVPLRRRG
jgi:hypothetical protein